MFNRWAMIILNKMCFTSALSIKYWLLAVSSSGKYCIRGPYKSFDFLLADTFPVHIIKNEIFHHEYLIGKVFIFELFCVVFSMITSSITEFI